MDLQVHYKWKNSWGMERLGNYPPNVAFAVVCKILKIAQRQKTKNPLEVLKLVNPKNGHEFSWTPRGWAETKLPNLTLEKSEVSEERAKGTVDEFRQLWKEAMGGNEIKSSKTGLIKGGNVVLKINGAVVGRSSADVTVFEKKSKA